MRDPRPPLPDDLRDAPAEPERYAAPLRNRRPLAPRRSRVAVAMAVAASIVAVTAGTGFVLSQRHRTTTVTATAAVERFRSGQLELAPELQPLQPQPPAGQPSPVSETIHPRAAEPPENVTVETAAFAPPPEGVYPYRASGGERISLLGASHEYPERVHVTISHHGGCHWQLRNDVIEEHVDVMQLCGGESGHLQHGQARTVKFLGQKDGDVFICEPPLLLAEATDEPGARSSAICVGEDGDEAYIERTFLGRERVVVAGRELEALRLRLDSTLTGSVEGTARDEMWADPRTGLPYRWVRSVDTVADSSLGKVRYQEEAEFTLEALEPMR